MKGAEVVFFAGVEQCGQIGLVVAAGTGPGAVVVETPDAAIGEDAPANAALRLDLGRRKVSEDLAVRRPGPEPFFPVAGVERKTEALALLDHGGVPVTGFRAAFGGGAPLGVGVGKKQVIGDVFIASGALLGQVVGPSKQFQDRTDQILLGFGFVGIRGNGGGCRSVGPRPP